ncbi:MAG TPA: tryptophan--tRNA ligase, partial [Rhodocyclaceae bacterium]|nr:tryptophan--tRNA ligase [Rhodocyclaceae bacterium]
DWHALTTHYESSQAIEHSVRQMIVDWIAAGVDPTQATLFVQSRIPEHAELHLLLSMITPLGWLERVPTYKDQQEKLADRELATYGFLGYPLLQSADILIYRASMVPVGDDQVPHVELTRGLARRFNHLFGREPGHEDKARAAVKKLGGPASRQFEALRTRFQRDGEPAAREQARGLLDSAQSLSADDRERLYGYLEGSGKMILVEPEARLTENARMPGLDGQKMSKSYENTIFLREPAESVTKKIRTMQTDPQRVRRSDPGNPEACPVWQFHRIYSDPAIQDWAAQGCRSAAIGCLDCKQPVIEAVLREQQPMLERAQPYLEEPARLRHIVEEGCERARRIAQETMHDVRSALGLNYR